MNIENKIVEKLFIPSYDLAIQWRVYWLKGVVYNSEIHDSSLNVKPHFHSFLEMQIVLDGELEYLIDGQQVTVYAGEFLLISPKISHQLVRYSENFQKIATAFSFQGEDSEFSDLNLDFFQRNLFFKGQNTNALIVPLQYILYELNNGWKESPMITRMQFNSFLLTLFHMVQDNIQEQQLPIEQKELNPNDEMIYNSIIQYLRENVSHMVSVEEASTALLISVRQINRVLRRTHATCFSKLRDEIKCFAARELLSGNLSMEKIGEEIGFSSVYSFNRFFKRVEGMTPGKFREAMRCSNCK